MDISIWIYIYGLYLWAVYGPYMDSIFGLSMGYVWSMFGRFYEILKCIKIKKNMGWCNDINNKLYNKEIMIKKGVKYEKLFRSDYKYNYFIPIKYNWQKPEKNRGSAIFIHLTKNYKPTLGCIALSKKDFIILSSLIEKKTKIKIN